MENETGTQERTGSDGSKEGGVKAEPSGEKLIKVLAHIRKNTTGEVRVAEVEDWLVDGHRNPSVYNWTDGNFGCDCNREILFDRAGGGDPDPMDMACTEGRFSVNLQNTTNLEFYHKEFGAQMVPALKEP